MNNKNELPAHMQQQDCHGAKQATKFAWPCLSIFDAVLPLLSLMNCSSACIAATASDGPTFRSPSSDDLNCCTNPRGMYMYVCVCVCVCV